MKLAIELLTYLFSKGFLRHAARRTSSTKGPIEWRAACAGTGSSKNPWRPAGKNLVDKGFLHEDDLTLALHEQWDIPIVDFSKAPKNRKALSLVSQGFAITHLVLPLTFLTIPQGTVLVVAMEDPRNAELIQDLHRRTGYAIKPMLGGRKDLLTAISSAYNQNAIGYL